MSYIIRTSDRKDFRKCRQLWDFTSKIRQNYEPYKRNINLDFGTAVHAGLEGYHDPMCWHDPEVRSNLCQMNFIESWETFKDSYDRLDWEMHMDLGRYMLLAYNKRAFPYTPVFTEKEFEVHIPVPLRLGIQINGGRHKGFKVLFGNLHYLPFNFGDHEPVVYQGRIDALVKDADGLYWIVDHKTAGSFSTLEFLEMDSQLKSYCWALQVVLGIKIHGAIYDELLKEVPHAPKQLKDGSFSKDKRQNTTAEVYKETLDEHGVSMVGYEDFLSYLELNPREYFRRTLVHYSQKELEIEGERIVLEAMDMLADPFIYPNPSRTNCDMFGGCAFRAPCLAAMDGSDETYILKGAYKVRDG